RFLRGEKYAGWAGTAAAVGLGVGRLERPGAAQGGLGGRALAAARSLPAQRRYAGDGTRAGVGGAPPAASPPDGSERRGAGCAPGGDRRQRQDAGTAGGVRSGGGAAVRAARALFPGRQRGDAALLRCGGEAAGGGTRAFEPEPGGEARGAERRVRAGTGRDALPAYLPG